MKNRRLTGAELDFLHEMQTPRRRLIYLHEDRERWRHFVAALIRKLHRLPTPFEQKLVGCVLWICVSNRLGLVEKTVLLSDFEDADLIRSPSEVFYVESVYDHALHYGSNKRRREDP